MDLPSMYEFAGGEPAFLALAKAFHARCLADPVLEHPFSHPGNPEHVERLADYWSEVLGGPPRYSASHGGHSAMLEIHARQGADEELGRRFVSAFVQAIDDAGVPEDPGSATVCMRTWSGPSRRCWRIRRRTPWWIRISGSHAGGGTARSKQGISRRACRYRAIPCVS